MDEQAALYSDLWFNVQHFDAHAGLSVVLTGPDGSEQAFTVQTAHDGTLGQPMAIPGHYLAAYGQYTLRIQGSCRGQLATLTKNLSVLL